MNQPIQIPGQNSMENGEDLSLKSTLVYPLGNKKIPLLLEFLFTLTKIVVISVGIFVILLSILNKSTWVDILVRGGITIFVLGLLGLLINWVAGKMFIQAAYQEMKEIEEKQMAQNIAKAKMMSEQ